MLAHSWSTARSCAGAGSDRKTSDNRLYALATAVHEIQDESGTPRVRADALSRLERLLQEQARTGLQRHNPGGVHHRPGLVRPRLPRARTALRAVAQAAIPLTAVRIQGPAHSPAGRPGQARMDDEAACRFPAMTLGLISHANPATASHTPRFTATRACSPPPSRWSSPSARRTPPTRTTASTSGSSNREGESRRVLYVGASRAQQLLILAVHQSRANDVRTALDRDGVNYIDNPNPRQVR